MTTPATATAKPTVKDVLKGLLVLILILAPFVAITFLFWHSANQAERMARIERDQLITQYIWQGIVGVQAQQLSVLERMQVSDSVIATMAVAPFIHYMDQEVGGLRDVVDSLSKDVYRDSLISKVRSLEFVLRDSPEKAIALPLMRNNLDIMQKRIEQMDKAFSDRMNSLTTSMFAFAGVLLTLVIGVPSVKKYLEGLAEKHGR